MQTCWITDSLPQWIQVDLGADYDIDRVSIAMFNPEDIDFLIEGKRENGQIFELSEEVSKYETFLEHGVAGSEITTSRFDTSPLQNARYVLISISSSAKSEIEINEIKIFGYKDSGLTNLEDLKTGSIPTKSKLLPNYPNPFNPETKIHYILRENSDVKLAVYNINGQIVKELVNKSMPAGEHIVEWNGKNQYSQEVSSGVYFAKIEMGSPSGGVITDSTKLILVR